MLNRNNLHAYQQRAVDTICNKPKCALWLDMGLGKTVSTLTAITDLIDSFTVENVLIVAPLRVANNTWHNEIANWEHLTGLTYSICTGSEKKRISALHRDADIYIINRENIKWLVDHYGKKWPFDMLVIDESSSFKSSTSQRFKALRKVLPHVDRLVELTGTPTSNGLLDLWAQMYLLDFGERLGRNMTAYKNRFFETDYMGYKYTPRKGSENIIYKLIDDLCITMLAKDYLELPKRIDLRVPVTLPPKLQKEYETLERDFIATISDADIEAFNAAALAGKLLQFCNGAVYTDENKNWVELHDLKIKALQDIVEDNPNENILVAYNYKTDLMRLQKAFPDAVVIDKEGLAIDEWNNGNIKMLLAHPACLHPDTEVLTEFRGWVKIIDVEHEERVFDGVEFVSHSGCSYSGYKPVIDVFGVSMTTDHKILINDQWVEARNVQDNRNVKRKALYRYAGNDSYLSSMLQLRENKQDSFTECSEVKPQKIKILSTLYKRYFSQYDRHENMADMVSHGQSIIEQKRQGLRKIWSGRSRSLPDLVGFQAILRGYAQNLRGQFDIRPDRQRQRLFKEQLSVDNDYGATIQQEQQSLFRIQRGKNPFSGIVSSDQYITGGIGPKARQRDERRTSRRGLSQVNIQEKPQKAHVYDLVDCGPRNRFLVRNDKGEVFISHNSAGHGLNLQHGGSMIVWFGLNWSLELVQQFNARLHRQGQTKPVRIVSIVADGCMDDKVQAAITNKAQTQSDLLNALKK